MSTKPTTSADWAAGGAITIPSAGKKSVGFVVGEAPAAQTFNWLHNLAGLWEKWLLDGDCDFHNLSTSAAGTLSIAGTSTFTGTATFSGLLVASLGINVPTGQAVALAGTTTLTVGGASTLTGAVALNGGATVATGQNMILAGTSRVKHATKTRSMAVAGGTQLVGGSFINDTGSWRPSATGQTLTVNIPLEVGEQLTNVTVRNAIVSTGDVLRVQVKHFVNGVPASNAAGSSSAGAGGAQSWSAGVMSGTVTPDGATHGGYVAIFDMTTLSTGTSSFGSFEYTTTIP